MKLFNVVVAVATPRDYYSSRGVDTAAWDGNVLLYRTQVRADRLAAACGVARGGPRMAAHAHVLAGAVLAIVASSSSV